MKRLFRDKRAKIEDGDLVVCNGLDGDPIILKRKMRDFNTMVVGPTGCGKSNYAFKEYIRQDLKNPKGRLILLDSVGHLSNEVLDLIKEVDRTNFTYFDPLKEDGPCINPLHGEIIDVIKNSEALYRLIFKNDNPFIMDMGQTLISNAVTVIKILHGNNATLTDLFNLINSEESCLWMIDELRHMAKRLSGSIKTIDDIVQHYSREQYIEDLIKYFREEYYGQELFNQLSEVRDDLAKLISNKRFMDAITPTDYRECLNFDEMLESGDIVVLNTNQGELRRTGEVLNQIVIMSLQDAVFRRSRDGDSKKQVNVYIPNYESFSNPQLFNVFSQGKGYGVSWTIGINELRELSSNIENEEDIAINKDVILSNISNRILFPGIDLESAKYLAKDIFKEEKAYTGESIRDIEFPKVIYSIVDNYKHLSGEGNMLGLDK